MFLRVNIELSGIIFGEGIDTLGKIEICANLTPDWRPVSVGGGRGSVGMGVLVGWVVLLGFRVLVDSGAAAVQAMMVCATAASTAPSGGAVGDSTQSASRKAKRIATYFFLIDSPFPAPLGKMVKAH
jgi:hypothetical protein